MFWGWWALNGSLWCLYNEGKALLRLLMLYIITGITCLHSVPCLPCASIALDERPSLSAHPCSHCVQDLFSRCQGLVVVKSLPLCQFWPMSLCGDCATT